MVSHEQAARIYAGSLLVLRQFQGWSATSCRLSAAGGLIGVGARCRMSPR